jgi:cellulose synthase (UDP-forming)
VYLLWRVTATRTGANPVLFWVLLVAELYGIFNFLYLAYTAWRLPPVSRPQATRHFSVDVFVCTYDEPADVVAATLAGCESISYPHQTYLLDDGRRPEMRDLALQHGAAYLTRPDNAHAKAGNINHALGRTRGELILVLDADHVPLSDVLDATVGYFEDPGMAVVQTPHDFYNRDSVQHASRRAQTRAMRRRQRNLASIFPLQPYRHEQSLFYEVIAPGKARHNAAYWCGSAAVIRRAALEDVGGVRTDTIAEDFHTTLAMHQHGWRTWYHNEVLVQGLAPHDLDSFLLQRDRWARGNLWVLHTRQSPLTARGLTLQQRISYLGSLVSYGSGLYRAALIAVLATTLVTGWLPIAVSPLGLVAVWLPWMLFTTVGSLALGRGSLGLLEAWRYGLLTMGIYSRAVLATLFGRRAGRFKVTPKGALDDGGLRVTRSLGMLDTMTVLLVAALWLRMAAMVTGTRIGPMDRAAEIVTVLLGWWTVAVIASAVAPLVTRHQQRSSWRFPVRLAGEVDGRIVQVVDLSPDGAGLELDRGWSFGDLHTLHLRLPGPGGQDRPLALAVEVRSSRESGPRTWRVGTRFVDLSERDRAVLTHYCYTMAMAATLDHVAPSATVAVTSAEPSDARSA